MPSATTVTLIVRFVAAALFFWAAYQLTTLGIFNLSEFGQLIKPNDFIRLDGRSNAAEWVSPLLFLAFSLFLFFASRGIVQMLIWKLEDRPPE